MKSNLCESRVSLGALPHVEPRALSWQSEFRLQQILLAYVLPMVLCLDLCYSIAYTSASTSAST